MRLKYFGCTVLTLAAVLLCVSTGTAQEQEQECNAKPRWIAATVLEHTVGPMDGQWEDIRFDGGLQLLDRCEFYGKGSIRAAEIGRDGGDGQSVITVIKFQPANDNTGTESFFLVSRWVLKETVQQLCAAMDDCGDATKEDR